MIYNFSLIISIYNKIKTSDLIESLKSIGNQSLKPNEVIIILDGYCNINLIYNLKKYLNLYYKNNYIIISNKKNMGIPYSYNRAIKLTKNHLVAISDADDTSYFKLLPTLILSVAFLYFKLGFVCFTSEILSIKLR